MQAMLKSLVSQYDDTDLVNSSASWQKIDQDIKLTFSAPNAANGKVKVSEYLFSTIDTCIFDFVKIVNDNTTVGSYTNLTNVNIVDGTIVFRYNNTTIVELNVAIASNFPTITFTNA